MLVVLDLWEKQEEVFPPDMRNSSYEQPWGFVAFVVASFAVAFVVAFVAVHRRVVVESLSS